MLIRKAMPPSALQWFWCEPDLRCKLIRIEENNLFSPFSFLFLFATETVPMASLGLLCSRVTMDPQI